MRTYFVAEVFFTKMSYLLYSHTSCICTFIKHSSTVQKVYMCVCVIIRHYFIRYRRYSIYHCPPALSFSFLLNCRTVSIINHNRRQFYSTERTRLFQSKSSSPSRRRIMFFSSMTANKFLNGVYLMTVT